MALEPISNTLYVSEDNGNKIRTITASGWVGTLAGTTASVAGWSYRDALGTAALLNAPNHALVFGSPLSLLVSEWGGGRLRHVSLPDGVVTSWAGTGVGGLWDGPATLARFRNPANTAVDANGVVWLADTGELCAPILLRSVLCLRPFRDLRQRCTTARQW